MKMACQKELKKGFDHIGVSVVYFCHDGKGKFVMAKRSAKARDENGCWDIGGAALEFGEKVEDALKREIKEEYCTDVLDYEFLGHRDVHRKHNGKRSHWIALDFKVRVNPKKVGIGEPHKFDEIGWFTLSKMPKKIHSALPAFLKNYRSKLE